MKRQKRATGLLHTTLGVMLAGGAVAGFFSSWTYLSRVHVGAALDGPQLSAGASVALMRARISPEALAAAGLTEAEATALLGRVADWWAEHGTGCATACSAADSAGITLDSLRRKAQSGLASEGDLTTLSSAATAYGTATSAHVAQMEAIWEAAVTGMDSEKAARLEAMRGHLSAGCRLPIAYLAAARSEPDGVALRDALAEVASQGEGASAAAQAIVTSANADTDVSAAKSNLTNRLAEVTSAWDAAVSGT